MAILPENIPFPQVDDPEEMRIRILEDIVRALRARLSNLAVQDAGGTPISTNPAALRIGDGLTVTEVSPGVARIDATGGGGGQYAQYLWEIDGSLGWNFVDEDDGTGQLVPVIALQDLE